MAENSTAFRIQLLETMASLITAGFGIVAALAWNEAIKKLINTYIPSTDSEVIGLFVYAIIVTVIVVAATILVSRSIAKLKAVDAKLQEKKSCGCEKE